MDAPVDELTRARRVIEEAEGTEGHWEKPSAKAARRAAKTFVAAVLRGEDITAHVPALLRCIRERAQESLSRALVVHYLRRGDADGIRQLAELPRGGDLRVKIPSAIDFAAAEGIEISPVYSLLVRWPSSGPWVLCRHLDRQPQRVGAVLAALAVNRSADLPSVLSSLACRSGVWEAWPAAVGAPITSFVMELLDSEDERDREAAAQALATHAQFPALDLASVRARLEAALKAGRSPRSVAMALTSDALSRSPADWNAVARLLAHDGETVREGAVQVLAWRWLRGRNDAGIVARLAAALLDSSPTVRQRAAETLAKGIDERRLLPRLDPSLLERLLAALADPDQAGAAGDFLEAYATSDPGGARDVLRAVETQPPADAAAEGGPPPEPSGLDAAKPEAPAPGPSGLNVTPRREELAKKCRDLLAARDPGSCPLCSRLRGQQWGEEFNEPTKPPPPELAYLRRLASRPEELHGCPHCGACYRIREGGGAWMNNEWTNYTLEWFQPPAGPGAVWVLTHELARNGDLARLDRELLRAADGLRRVEALETMKELVFDGFDFGPVEPTLRELLAGPVARSAGDVLGRHWIRAGRSPEVLALLGSHDPEVMRGALEAVWHAATRRVGDVSPYLDHARELLGDLDQQVRRKAREILETAGMQGEEGLRTAAAATRWLDSEDPGVRRHAASLLEEAAKQGVDIGVALPRLGTLLADDACAGPAADALLRAAWQGTHVATLLPELVARLRKEKDTRTIVGILRALQDDGVDISSAFDALQTIATPGSWADRLLEEGRKSGR